MYRNVVNTVKLTFTLAHKNIPSPCLSQLSQFSSKTISAASPSSSMLESMLENEKLYSLLLFRDVVVALGS